MQSAKWKRQVTHLQAGQEKAGVPAGTTPVRASSGLTLPTSTGLETDSPTISLMEDVDLMRQIDLLTSENQRLNEEIKRIRKNSADGDKADRDRAAIDGTGGGGILR